MTVTTELEAGGLESAYRESRARISPAERLYRFPWWALALVVAGAFIAFLIAADETFATAFSRLQAGILMSLRVAISAYALAFCIGFVVGAIRAAQPTPGKGLRNGLRSALHLLLYNAATLYMSIMRGLPVLIVILIFAFVIMKGVKDWLLASWGVELPFRLSSPETAIIALAFTYGAFLSETMRAGIQSIERGQIEAARSLGMPSLHILRFIILPQALRRVLPPLGNDFIAMIKDSSLVSILGVRDITQIAKVTAGGNFQYTAYYTTAALIYLTLTLLGAMLVGQIERRFRTPW